MENQVKVVVYCYKYVWKTSDSKMCVKFITGPVVEHERFMEALKTDENVLSALREYVHEIDFDNLNKVEAFKKEDK